MIKIDDWLICLINVLKDEREAKCGERKAKYAVDRMSFAISKKE